MLKDSKDRHFFLASETENENPGCSRKSYNYPQKDH
jgi:hypothetical protein